MQNAAPLSALVAATVALAWLLPAPAAAQTAPPAAVDAYNADLQELWDAIAPAVRSRLHTELMTQLGAARQVSSSREVSVRRVAHVRLGLDRAFGLGAVTRDRLELKVPAQGSWSFDVDVDVRIRQKVAWWWVSATIPVRLIVDRVRLVQGAALDWSDPDRPVVRRVEKPQVSVRVRLRSRNVLADLVLRLLSPVADRAARRAVAGALKQAGPSLAGVQGAPGPIHADGAPALTDSGAATPFRQVVRTVERRIRAEHMPAGLLCMTEKDVPVRDESWLDAYAQPNRQANPGRIVAYRDWGDAPAWTGHLLAAEAYRYSLSRGGGVGRRSASSATRCGAPTRGPRP